MAYTIPIMQEYQKCIDALDEAEEALNSGKYAGISELEQTLTSDSKAMGMVRRHKVYGARLQDVLGKLKEAKAKMKPAVADGISREYLTLENLACYDADGNEYERHGRLYVPKNIEKNADGSQISNAPYNWIVYFEQRGMSLPPFPVTCAILDALWQNRNNADCMNVLIQYKGKGNDYGWHCQNTLVNWGSGQVIHYPSDSDFTSNGGNSNVNAGKRKALSFDRKKLKDCTLRNALKIPEIARFVKQFTGLKNPGVLVEIGEFFGKPAKVWTSSSNETRAAWLGCYDNVFNLYAYEYLGNYDAARGVSRSCEQPRAASRGERSEP